MIRRISRPAPNPNGPGYTPGITSAGVPGQTPPELQSVPVPLPPADLPEPPPPSWTRAASAELPAAGRAGARGDWRSLTELRSISIGRLACRSVALAMVGTVLTACGSWRGIANVPIPGGRAPLRVT
jgi:hypothetical protein